MHIRVVHKAHAERRDPTVRYAREKRLDCGRASTPDFDPSQVYAAGVPRVRRLLPVPNPAKSGRNRTAETVLSHKHGGEEKDEKQRRKCDGVRPYSEGWG